MTLYIEGKTPLDVNDLSVKEATSGFAGERHEARDGASDVSAKDRGHCFDTLEQGGTFRRRTTEAASSLSVAQNSDGLPDCMPRWGCICSANAALSRQTVASPRYMSTLTSRPQAFSRSEGTYLEFLFLVTHS